MEHVAERFRLQSDYRQLYIFAGSLDEKVAASINNLMGLSDLGLPVSHRKSIEIELTKMRQPFCGLNSVTYSPSFPTRMMLQVVVGKDTQQYMVSLEILANKVLELIPGRCVVWTISNELYRKGF